MKQILCTLLLLIPSGLWASDLPDPPAAPQPTAETDVASLPTGEVSGLLKMPRHEKMPEKLTGRIRLPAAFPQKGLPDEMTVDCPVVDDRWVCHFPAGRFDLRLRARGFLSHFLWSVEVKERRRLDVGTLELHRGASVVGRVEAPHGEISLDDLAVTLSPLAHGYDQSQTEGHRRAQRLLEGEVDKGGFYRFEGVRPGDYKVEATQAGLGEARLFPITVMENAETEVQQPLRLEPPLELEIVVQPALDPYDRPWRWELHEEADGPFQSRLAADGLTDDSGFARAKKLSAGDHTLFIKDADGQRYALEQLDLSPTSGQVFIDLPLVFVEGTIRLGEEPLTAEIHFGGKGGKHRVVLESDGDGKFSGVLPEEGEWKAYVRSKYPEIKTDVSGIEVRRLDGASAAYVDIDLPDTEIAGEVVDEEGRPVFAAQVQSMRLERGSSSSIRTDREGRFRLRGMPPGPQMISAHDSGESSEQILVHAEENRPKLDLRLVLREDQKLTGQVVAPSGGVPGARILALTFQPDGSIMLMGNEAGTDVQGNFELSVPGAGSRVELAVLAPAYAFHIQEVTTDRRDPVVLQVEPQGGALHLDLEPIATEDGEASPIRPIIIADGRVLDPTLLRHWAHLNGEMNEDPKHLVIPQMPAGSYVACFHKVDAAFLQNPSAAPFQGCVEGFLSPGGSLDLGPTLAPSQG